MAVQGCENPRVAKGVVGKSGQGWWCGKVVSGQTTEAVVCQLKGSGLHFVALGSQGSSGLWQ